MKEPTVVIFGVSSALGRAVAKSLMPDYRVVGTYCKNMPKDLDCELFYVDVRTRHHQQQFFAAQKLDSIVLVNMFGVNINGLAHRMHGMDWFHVLDVNLNGTFHTCSAALPVMRAQGWGRIINISSIVGQMGIPGTAAYAASKQGIIGLTRAIAAESGRKGITANVLALGYFDRGIIDQVPEAMQCELKNRIPVQGFGDPENIAHAIRFLIAANYVNGAVININGGLL